MLSEQLPKRLGQPAPAATAAARADLIEQLRIALSGCSDPAFEKLLGEYEGSSNVYGCAGPDVWVLHALGAGT